MSYYLVSHIIKCFAFPWHSLMKYTLPESNAPCVSTSKYCIWKKFSIQVIEHTNNYFHITSTTASNFKQSKISCIFGKFSHFKLKSAPTQDKFLDFLQNEFSHSKYFQKAFFHLNGGQALCACACPDGHAPPFKWKELFGNIMSVKIHFVKKSRNLSWVGADFSLKWLNFPKNAWNFALVEIWSGCRCDMKIIFGVFDNFDIELLSHKIFCHHLLYKIS